ncbi:DUF1283 domain-containing protein [Pectobacteriaceae bacterium CE70]|uniref:DUF1283 domain-containing protein n=1 Tax=Brenneria uluponensis TaxID=3057057 RepID=UPI0028EF61D1|nr:DUF1283 domain-containing protein [Brenneria ulupoensis]WJV64557.1 DUF1283 domain-containing protein [Pectobacteriaceae bacterium C52]WJV65002.1 DUF1283 domain-containing protein [Pectobacteriaceae bacterium CE70]WJY09023.1 DUF1283 domain-containing protein [Pectobacteriaceae bacterium C80]WJY17026.1 DUF1283 domain-containing protein [Pectobacteriaceae bacterium CE90]
MNRKFPTSLLRALIPLSLVVFAGISTPSIAETHQIIIDNGNSAISKEAVRQSKEDRNETRNLRNKKVKIEEKLADRQLRNIDREDRALDSAERCKNSSNFNAYWESSSARCLDRRTGRPINP